MSGRRKKQSRRAGKSGKRKKMQMRTRVRIVMKKENVVRSSSRRHRRVSHGRHTAKAALQILQKKIMNSTHVYIYIYIYIERERDDYNIDITYMERSKSMMIK